LSFVYVITGVVLLSAAIYLAMNWKQEADLLRRWSAMMSRRDGRPWWRRGLHILTETQSVVALWVLIAIGACLAVVMIAGGLGAG
jgi:hypothetical protein